MDAEEEVYRACPFDARLARTPYLVIPKLALQSMPMDWRDRFEALLVEADEAGLETPEYHVFRDVTYGNPEGVRGCKQVNPDAWGARPFYRLTGGKQDDPWADYRHGRIKDVCPTYRLVQHGAPAPIPRNGGQTPNSSGPKSNG